MSEALTKFGNLLKSLASPMRISVIEVTTLSDARAASGDGFLLEGADEIEPMRDNLSPAGGVRSYSVTTATPTFKLVFLSVVALTALCGVGQVALAEMWTEPTANQQNTFDAIGFAWKAGVGSILGLVGGKLT